MQPNLLLKENKLMHGHSLPNDHKEEHSCSECHKHEHLEELYGHKSLTKKMHEHNGHQCIDSDCEIEAPHGHNKLDESINNHAHENNHSHDHHHNHKFPLFPLEDFISHSKLPKTLREIVLNSSFISPAMICSKLIEKLNIAPVLKTWTSISTMHLFNRGKQKLSRLGLTYFVSGLAQLGSMTSLGYKASRFIATSLIAVIEKFSDNGHHHDEETILESVKREMKNLQANISSKKKWQELLPNLFNIEAKVQLVAPLMNKFSSMISESIPVQVLAKIFLTSTSFVSVDKLLEQISKQFGNNLFSSSIGALCGCCGSPVCSAAATDLALQTSLES